jgi:tetratricopeptide (TPR) repeat protein
MRDQVAQQVNKVINLLLVLVVVMTPLLFLPVFTDFFETTKIALLVGTVLVTLLLWAAFCVIRGKVLLTRTPLDVPLLLVGLVASVSAFFSPTQYISIFGSWPQVHGSAVAIVSYILLYFVATAHVRSKAQIHQLVYAMVASATIAGLLSLLAYFNLFLPLPFVKYQAFTPAGTSFNMNAVLLFTLPILLFSIVRGHKVVPPVVAVILATVFTLTIALTGRNGQPNLGMILSPAWIGVYVAYGLVYISSKKSDITRSLPLLMIPVVITVVVTVLSLLPVGGKFNLLKTRADSYPQEVQLPFRVSWGIAASSLINTPFLGSGPASFAYNYSAFRPAETNMTRYWNFRFDSAYNEFLTTLSTQGVLGLLAIIFFAAVVLNFALRGLRDEENTIASALAAAAMIGIVLMLVHVTTAVMMVTFMIVLAMLMATHKSTSNKVEELTIGIKASKITDSSLVAGDILPIVIFLPVSIFVIWAGWISVSMLRADMAHRMALNTVSTDPIATYNYLVEAENLNPNADLYRVDLAQTNFAIANAIAAAKAPSEASPTGSLTDEDKAQIQQLIQQSIREAQIAAALSPRNSVNYEVLANIYRQISGIAQDSLTFSLSAYGQAIALDPMNPILRLSVGGVYYTAQNYDLAIRFFTDAVNLKPDYANAYFNLSIALRDKGDLQSAQQVAERLVAILQKDTNNPDYKLAGDYLADLKARIATGSAQQSSITPPAAQTNATIQEDAVKSKIDLGNTPIPATPAAIKR